MSKSAAKVVEETPAPARPSDAARLAANVKRWRPNPRLFVVENFKATPDPWQDDVLRTLKEALETGDATKFKIALKACKGPGKTCVLAWIILWFLVCFKQSKILCTSITFENLRDGLWAELSFWMEKSPLLCVLLEKEAERLYVKGNKETWFCSARTWPKDADKNKQADTLAGLHARNTMVVVDESGGVPVGVLAAALAHHSTQEPGATEVHFTVIAGNPTDISGSLGWACTTDAKNWWVKEITGDPDDPKRAARIDPKWAREQIEKFGANNPWVLVNVYGKFPPVGSNKLLGPDEVRAAMACTMIEASWRNQPRVMALDVARSVARDRSSLCRRQGPVVFPFRVYRLDDAIQLAGQVAFEFARWPAQFIVIDATGLGGPVADHLRSIGLPVVEFHAGMPARDPRFVDRRTETWWEGSQKIKGINKVPGLSLPQFTDLIPDLTEAQIEFTAKGQMRLESKEKMLKRGIESPDLGDSLMMSFAEPFQASWSLPSHTIAALGRNHTQTEWDPFEET